MKEFGCRLNISGEWDGLTLDGIMIEATPDGLRLASNCAALEMRAELERAITDSACLWLIDWYLEKSWSETRPLTARIKDLMGESARLIALSDPPALLITPDKPQCVICHGTQGLRKCKCRHICASCAAEVAQ